MFERQNFTITLPNSKAININCQTIHLKQKLQKQDVSVPYEFMMLVNDKINYIYQSNFELTKTFVKEQQTQEVYNLKMVDMQQVYPEYLQLKKKNSELQKELNETSRFQQETSDAYQDSIRKNLLLLNEISELESKIQYLETRESQNSEILISDQNKVNEKLQQKIIELGRKEQINKELNQKISDLQMENQQIKNQQLEKDKQQKKKIEELEIQLNDQNYNQVAIQNQFVQLKNEFDAMLKDYGVLQQKYQELYPYYQYYLSLGEEKQTLEKNLAEKSQKLNDLQQQIGKIKQEYESLMIKCDQKNQDCERLENKLENQKKLLNNEINDLKQQLLREQQYTQVEIKDKDEEISELKKKIRNQKQLLQSSSQLDYSQPITHSSSFIYQPQNPIKAPNGMPLPGYLKPPQ